MPKMIFGAPPMLWRSDRSAETFFWPGDFRVARPLHGT